MSSLRVERGGVPNLVAFSRDVAEALTGDSDPSKMNGTLHFTLDPDPAPDGDAVEDLFDELSDSWAPRDGGGTRAEMLAAARAQRVEERIELRAAIEEVGQLQLLLSDAYEERDAARAQLAEERERDGEQIVTVLRLDNIHIEGGVLCLPPGTYAFRRVEVEEPKAKVVAQEAKAGHAYPDGRTNYWCSACNYFLSWQSPGDSMEQRETCYNCGILLDWGEPRPLEDDDAG